MPELILSRLQRVDRTTCLGERLCRCAPVRGLACDAGVDVVVQLGHAHSEELVQVRRCDSAVPDAFEQRELRIGCELEDTAIEVDPRELAIEESPLRRLGGFGCNLEQGHRYRTAGHESHCRGSFVRLRHPARVNQVVPTALAADEAEASL